MKWVAGYAGGLCVLILIVAQSFFIPSFFLPFFSWHYERRDIAASIGVDDEELMRVTSELLNYMRGRRDDLEVSAIVNGQSRSFFSETEIIHMEDVREIYSIGFIIRNVAFWGLIFIILALIFMKESVAYILSRCVREIVVGFLILTFLLVIIIAIDFSSAFVMFHLMFFDNDYWILDPSVDLLINMVPEIFFIEISVFIAGLLALFSILIIILSSVYLSNNKYRFEPLSSFDKGGKYR